MRELFNRWWQGAYIPPENDPKRGLVFVTGTYELHWSAKAAHVVADFWMRHWQWCFSAAFATIGLVIAAMKL